MLSSLMTKYLTVAALAWPFVGAAPVKAQETEKRAEPPPPTLFSQFFPEPTGANGYEETAMACDLVRENKMLRVARQQQATLSDKRRALADPDCARALLLLRQGLAKPTQPHKDSKYPTGMTVAFTDVLTLLRVEQYVLLADGRTAAAINSLREGLRLAYRIQTEGLFGSGFFEDYGSYVLRYLLLDFVKHLPQLSAPDCDSLIALVRQYLAAPDPAASLLERKRQQKMEMIVNLRESADPSLWQSALRGAEGGGGITSETIAVRGDLDLLRNNPAGREALASLLTKRVNGYYEAQIVRFRSSSYKPHPILPPPATPADRLAWFLLRFQSEKLDSLATHRVQLQLLGVHAAIRRFRWEHNRLPTSLAETDMKKLAIDPFTGKEFAYKVASPESYELSSAAPLKINPNGSVTNASSPVSAPH